MPLSNVIKGMCSALQKGGNVVDGVASLETEGEWMLGQSDSRLVLISLQCRLERGLKPNRS